MSRDYQRMDGSNGNGGAGARPTSTSPRGAGGDDVSAASANHHHRNVKDADDPQAPWNTNLEYSIDPAQWVEDSKHAACQLCNKPFTASIMGGGRHHCRMCGCLCCGACGRGSIDLPGYDSNVERVCEPCRKRVIQLRAYLLKHQEALLNNVAIVNRDAIAFSFFPPGGAEPVQSELWLAGNMLMCMWKDKISSIEVGFASQELKERISRTVCCCMQANNPEFAAKEPLLFSMLLTDGRTVDFAAPTPALRNEWVDRLRGLVAHTAAFVSYHFLTARYDPAELVRRERTRLDPQTLQRAALAAKAAKRAQEQKGSATDQIRQKYQQKKKG